MNGAILGMTKAEIDRKLDEIVDFSGVERYLETPVKRYSSGMTVRLGFAIAAHLDPEILVVDEVLAVGDAEFQKKAIGKMQDVSRGGGRTVLFVSHNMGAVKSLCNTGIILENGSTSFISDDINVTVAKYLHEEKEQLRVPLAKRKDRQGNGNIHIVDVLFCGKNNYVNISNDEKLNFDIVFENRKKINNPKILISINTYDDQCILFLDSTTIHDSPKILNVKSKLHIRLSDEFSLIPNSYYVNIACYEDEVLSDYIQKAFTFDIIQGAFYSGGRMPVGNGLCMVKQEWFFQ
jgi:lipopolysaccharide transport system ATP-binding protein